MNTEEMDRLRELAEVGARRAADAFTQIADRPIEVAQVVLRSAEERGDAYAGEWSSGVFFELEGCFDALVGVMFHSTSRDAIVERMLGEEAKVLADWCVESALTELANILVSHVASGIADRLGERLLPSVPSLALDHAGEALGLLSRERSADLRIECELREPSGDFGGLLVLVPGRPDST